jgi:hypothetical protein
MTATERELELRVSNATYQRVSDWLGEELRDNARHGLIGAGFVAIAAVIANAVLYFLLVSLEFWLLGHRMGASTFVWPALLLAAMYPAYFFWGRQPYRRVALDSGEVRIPMRFDKPIPLAGSSDGDFPLRDWLFFPAWLSAKAIRQALTPMRAARADTLAMARILVYLLERNRRVSLHDLENELRLPDTAALLNSLTEIDGVLFFHADFPAVSLNDDLRQKVASFL